MSLTTETTTSKPKSFTKENTEEGVQNRLAYLEALGTSLVETQKTNLKINQIKNNIEAFVGSTSIPTGLVGPLLFDSEPVFTLASTTEGALVASMNRGASVINACGGFRAIVQDKTMLRAPMFCFENINQANIFSLWLKAQQSVLAEYIKRYSRRAELIDIKTNLFGRNVDAKFYYRTQDASGQNITTICTWHACLWIEEQFNQTNSFKIKNFVLEGNGGADKKFTYNALVNGRGVSVVAEAIIDHEVLEKRLKVKAQDVLHFFNISHQLTTHDGMVGNNINVANSIAAIFAATGQDLACLHESAVGLLQIEPHERGLYFSLKLPKLVIGTVGGGTSLPTQREALELMGCYGTGKVERFAKLIAGFSLGLEISTITAMISGQFALAHERLGRNKPVSFIDLDELKNNYLQSKVESYKLTYLDLIEDKNGIITELSKKQVSKHIGLSLWQVDQSSLALLKSKPTYQETLNSMYIITGLIDPSLAKAFCLYQNHSEFAYNHNREIIIYDKLSESGFTSMPKIYGTVADHEREGHMVLMEYLDESQYRLINSENTPHLWRTSDFNQTVNRLIEASERLEILKTNPVMKEHTFEQYGTFMKAAINVLKLEYASKSFAPLMNLLQNAYEYLSNHEERILKSSSMKVVHNDFNPRNLAVKENGEVKIYDWELSCIDVPHRDFMELYSYTKNAHMNLAELKNNFNQSLGETYSDEVYKYAFSKFIVTRLSLYLLGHKLSNYKFLPMVIKNVLEINAEEKYFA